MSAIVALLFGIQSSPPGTLPPERFCVELLQVVAAASERPAFRSLEGATAQPRLTFANCRITDASRDRRYVCAQSDAPLPLRREALVDATLRCLPRAFRMAEPPSAGITRIRVGSLAILISDSGRPDGRGPRAVTYSVVVVPIHRR